MSAGIDEFISTRDIKNMADGIRSILHHRTDMFRYNCQDDIFWIELSYDNGSDLFFTLLLLYWKRFAEIPTLLLQRKD